MACHRLYKFDHIECSGCDRYAECAGIALQKLVNLLTFGETDYHDSNQEQEQGQAVGEGQ